MTTPSRSPTGAPAAAICDPTACGQAPWTAASSVCGAVCSWTDRSAAPRLRGERPKLTLHRWRARFGFGAGPLLADGSDRSPGAKGDLVSPRRRDLVRLGGGEQRLAAAGLEARAEQPPAFGVELAGDVVEEHHRRRAALRQQHLALGEQQPEDCDPLLALGPVATQSPASKTKRQVVEMRAPGGEPTRQVGCATLAELASQLGGVTCLGPGGIGKLRLSLEAELGAGLGEGRREQGRGGGSSGDQLGGGLGQLDVPGIERVGARGARPHPAQQGVSLRQRPRVPAASLRASRPQSRNEAIEVRAPGPGRAFDQDQPVGHEYGQRRSQLVVLSGDGDTVEAVVASLGMGDRTREVAPLGPVDDGGDRPPQRRLEANRLAIVRGPARAPGEPGEQRLEQVRLAGGVRPPGKVDPSLQFDLAIGEVAKGPRLQPLDDHLSLTR